MLRERFVEKSAATLPQWKMYHINFIVSKLDEYEAKSGNKLEAGWDKAEFIKFFNFCNMRHASNFGHYRAALISYVEFVEQETDVRMLDAISTVRFNDISYETSNGVVSFYTSIEQFLDAIDESIVYEMTYGVTIDSRRYDMAKIALILSWYGFSMEELLSVEKRDVTDFGVMKNGTLVYMPTEIVSLFKDCINSQGYMQQARGEIFRTYKDSKYLLRSPWADQLTPSAIKNQISELNSVMDKKYSLTLNLSYISGMYFRAYMAQCANPKIDLFEPENYKKYFEEDVVESTRRYRHKQQFSKYKSLLTQPD